jgi:RNA polymerase sigma-70 factor (ECF subfamily)
VRNAAISGLRSSGSRQRRERSIARNRDALFASDPTTPLVASEATEALWRLGAELRETLTLRIWGQLTFAEIAVVTDTPLSTVHHRYHEALADLRARLEKPCPKI